MTLNGGGRVAVLSDKVRGPAVSDAGNQQRTLNNNNNNNNPAARTLRMDATRLVDDMRRTWDWILVADRCRRICRRFLTFTTAKRRRPSRCSALATFVRARNDATTATANTRRIAL